MRTEKGFPPNIEKIFKVLPAAANGDAIFTYGDKVYTKDGRDLSPELTAHELVHVGQQGDKPDEWWKRYLSDVEFRFQEELEAHRAEWQIYCAMFKDRNQQYRYGNELAKRLSGPLYGKLHSYLRCRSLIKRKSC